MYCKVEYGYEIAGSVQRGFESMNKVYSSQSMSGGVIPSGEYAFIIGNKFNSSLGLSNAMFKEVRFWQRALSLRELHSMMFT